MEKTAGLLELAREPRDCAGRLQLTAANGNRSRCADYGPCLRLIPVWSADKSVLKARTPTGALKDWHYEKPELFKERPYNHSRCDFYAKIDKWRHRPIKRNHRTSSWLAL